MPRTFFGSLFARIGMITIMVVSVVLLGVGLFYTARFSTEIDRAIKDRIQLPGALMNRQVLRYDTIASKDLMTELVGDEFVDGMVIGADGHVYYAFRPGVVGEMFTDLGMDPGMDLSMDSLLEQAASGPMIIPSEERDEMFLTCISPIVAFQGAEPFFYALVKVRTTASEARKTNIMLLFLLGSGLCVLLTSAAIMAFTRTFIIRPVLELEKSATRLAQGDLDQEFAGARTGELASLANSFRAMRDAIRLNIRGLEWEKRRLNAFMGAVPDIVLVQDADGVYREVFTVDENLLYDLSENLLGRHVDEVFPPDLASVFRDVLDQTITTGAMQVLEYELDVKAGKRWFEGRTSLIPPMEDQLAHMVFVARDVTHRKQMEESLYKAKEEAEALAGRLVEMDRMKSSFLSSVSHELRTPLTSLLGFAKLIRKDFTKLFKPLVDEDARLAARAARIDSNLQVIVLEGERLTRLINNVLDLHRMESGRMHWHDTLLDTEELLKHSFHVGSGQFVQDQGVVPRLELGPGLPAIKADPDRIQQVLINLLDNAAKFTDNGHVTLRAERDADGMLRIQVEDTGAGIPREHLAAVFEKYQQSDDSDTLGRKNRGTGLGLAICREIVHNYGGDITVESDMGKGSVFTVVLPPAPGTD